ncbi:hypothetical protein BOW48_11965, partial [Solemya velum gill symbiont]
LIILWSGVQVPDGPPLFNDTDQRLMRNHGPFFCGRPRDYGFWGVPWSGLVWGMTEKLEFWKSEDLPFTASFVMILLSL